MELRPGNYTIESDRPVTFHGKAYKSIRIVDIVAGRDTVLNLTSDNAEVQTSSDATATAPLEADSALLVPKWKDSVVGLWSPTSRGSGFVIDASGVIVTNQKTVGAATSVEVQLTPVAQSHGKRPCNRCRP